MTANVSEYHRRVAAANRGSILAAASDLFLQDGYDRTSLARVAEAAGVSKATLFKQFPTKAALFEATVLAAGDSSPDELPQPPAGDLERGLVVLGLAYAEILGRPRIEALLRTIIAEAPRFPELRERTFDFGTLPVLSSLRAFLVAETSAGRASAAYPDTAAPQFLGMIATVVFWPRLVHGGSLTDDEIRRVVEEAAKTMVARYGR
ncbi:TetR/AcrR family transcriptional regulator [Microbacterium invictum]|uniref:TetR/AcrR family transcriptional regulator n=1 Tax=Microbacterium invictum TaxID=515415 RepID=A0ABZ0VAD9_9MICO|nr:TetR/AcrR family transcriptional regulator [Microbacterium invictum]WQB69661.1 TetR/AcrR family transcriptional regulator [Microbacterium invictum]